MTEATKQHDGRDLRFLFWCYRMILLTLPVQWHCWRLQHLIRTAAWVAAKPSKWRRFVANSLALLP